VGRTTKRRAGTRLVPRAVREEQLLVVAGEGFAERGFHAASMDEIAERADISKPMLYAYFGSKEGLYSALMQRIGGRLVEAMDAAVDPDLEPGEQVWASMTAFLGFVERHREGWAAMQAELNSRGGPFAEDVARVRARIVRRMAALLATRLDEAHADALAHGFVGAGESLAAWWLQHPEHTLEDVARLVMEVGWTGVGGVLEGSRWAGEPPRAARPAPG
jgi:AcrR family transcriptional regulator